MSADPDDSGPARESPERQPRPQGVLQPTPPSALLVWGLVGLVGGWLLRPVSLQLFDEAPLVTWAQPVALYFVAAVLGVTAWATWRALQVDGVRLPAQQAVNRLVLARASAYAGALVAGGYLGYAVSWLGLDTEYAEQRLVRSGVAGLAGVSVVVAALLLEYACRVRSKGEQA